MLKSLHNVTLQEILQVHVAEVIAENGSTELINLMYTVTMNVVQVQQIIRIELLNVINKKGSRNANQLMCSVAIGMKTFYLCFYVDLLVYLGVIIENYLINFTCWLVSLIYYT